MNRFGNLILLIGLLGASSVGAQEFKSGGVAHINFFEENLDALNVRDAKCGFLSHELFRCIVPVVLPDTSEFGEPSSTSIRLQRTSLNDGNEIFLGLSQLELKVSGKSVVIDFTRQEAQRLVYRAYDGIIRNAVEYGTKVREINEIAISDSDLRESTDVFRLRLQKTAFAPVFSMVEDILRKIADQKKINITRNWQISFGGTAVKEMVLDYCGAKGKGDKDCQRVQSFIRP